MAEPRVHSWHPGSPDSSRRVGGTVAAVMSAPPVTIEVDATVAEALARMRERGIHHLLLTDRGRIVAVVSDRDLVRGMPAALERREHEERVRRPVFSVAQYHLATIEAHATVEEASAEMLRHDVSSLAVVNAAEEIVGIMTSRDLLRHLAGRSGTETGSRPVA